MPGIELPEGLPGWAQALCYVVLAAGMGVAYWQRFSRPKAEIEGAGPHQAGVVVAGSLTDTTSMVRLAASIKTLASAESEQTETIADGLKDIGHSLERNRACLVDLTEELRRCTRAAEGLSDELRLSRRP